MSRASTKDNRNNGDNVSAEYFGLLDLTSGLSCDGKKVVSVIMRKISTNI